MITLKQGWKIFIQAWRASRFGSLYEAAEWMYRLNVFARSMRRHPIVNQVYDLKNALIKHLYQHGYCTEVRLHLQKRLCHACDGTGEYWDGDDCYKCNGTGVFAITRLYAFRFDIHGKSYAWHQLEKLVDYPVTLTELQPSEWIPPRADEAILSLEQAWLGCCVVWWYLLLHGVTAHLMLFNATGYRMKAVTENWWHKLKHRTEINMINFHAQSLGKEGQSIFRYGRCWLSFFGEWLEIHLEWWFFGRTSTTIGFDFAGEEDDFGIHIAIDRLFSIFFMIDRFFLLRRLFRDIRGGFGYKTSIAFHDNIVWVYIAYNERWGACGIWQWTPKGINVWSAADKSGGFGFYVSVAYLDILLGSHKYSTENLGEPVDVQVYLHPDTTVLQRNYIARVQMHVATWQRPRWPWPIVIRRAEIECIPPIPEPGKGESDWDLDDDAVHSMTCAADSPEEAVEKLVASVQDRRKSYGLPHEIYEAYQQAMRL